MTRFIIHADTSTDAMYGLRACQALEAEGYKECLFTYGERPNETTVFVQRNKTGLSARVISREAVA